MRGGWQLTRGLLGLIGLVAPQTSKWLYVNIEKPRPALRLVDWEQPIRILTHRDSAYRA